MRIKKSVYSLITAVIMTLFCAGSILPAQITGSADAEPAYIWFGTEEENGELRLEIYFSGTIKNAASFTLELDYDTELLNFENGRTYNLGSAVSSVSGKDGKAILSFAAPNGIDMTDKYFAEISFSMIKEGDIYALFNYRIKEFKDNILNDITLRESFGEFSHSYTNDGRSYYRYIFTRNYTGVKTGQEFTTELAFQRSGGIVSGSFMLYYDRSQLDLIAVEPTKWADGVSVTTNDVGDEYTANVKVAFACSKPIESAVPFFTFKVLPKVPNYMTVSVQDFEVTSPQLKTSKLYDDTLVIISSDDTADSTVFRIGVPENASVGKEVNITVDVSDNKGFGSLTGTLEYDTELFEYVRSEITDGFFQNSIASITGATAGKVKIGAASAQKQTAVGSFAKISLKPKKLSAFTSVLKFTVTELTDENSNPMEYTSVPAQISISNTEVINDPAISGQVEIKGPGDTSDTDVWITDSNGNVSYAVTDENGSFKVDTLEEGTYTVTAKKKGYPAVNKEVTVQDGSPQELIFELYQYGDCNQDRKVNLKDYVLFQRFLCKWNVEIYLSVCDLNNDGKVNMKDLVILQRYLNKWNIVFE